MFLQLCSDLGIVDRWTRGIPPPFLSLYTDASLSCWGALHLDLTASGIWSAVEAQEHISVLETQAVELALSLFLPQLVSQSVFLMTRQCVHCGLPLALGRHSAPPVMLDGLGHYRLGGTQLHLSGGQVHSGKRNSLTDQLSRPDQILPTEWSLLPRVFDGICRVFGRPLLDLFAPGPTTSYLHLWPRCRIR